MKKSLLTTVSIIIIITIVSVFVILFRSQVPSSTISETVPSVTTPESIPSELHSEYPMNLIEGKITKIEKKESKTEFTIEARLNKIFLDPPFDTKAVIVSADKNTKTFVYDMGEEKETPIDIASFQINDQVLINIVESNWDIMIVTSYTATKIDKMIIKMEEDIRENS